MPRVPITICPYCRVKVIGTMVAHMRSCKRKPVRCPHCRGMFRGELSIHLASCPQAPR